MRDVREQNAWFALGALLGVVAGAGSVALLWVLTT